ncbi:hypothetical protein ON010_g8358 [Phytophthora cinnamomi]|nr:hypothetical protein ON010_g8358 [Phytophthora cinnamomi]
MYAWHFPNEQGYGVIKGYRHKWSAAVVWLDNPAFEKPKILAVSTIGASGVYEITENGTPPECGRWSCDPPFALTTVRGQGEFQDLIMWDQLTEEVRSSLSTADFAPPFIEKAYKPNLESARPFY